MKATVASYKITNLLIA